MNRRNRLLTIFLVSGGLGLGVQAVSAQNMPGSAASGPGSSSGSGLMAPQSDPTLPRQTQPTIPGQAAPSTPGRIAPVPGQQGTIPERMEPPDANRQGMANTSPDEIRKAQEALAASGHDPGATDGAMNSKTQQALRDFQRENKLPVTGVLDPQTAAKLGIMPGHEPGASQPHQDNASPDNAMTPHGAGTVR